MDELRKAYHDRIADLRATTIVIVDEAAQAAENVTGAMLDRDPAASAIVLVTAGEAEKQVAGVEAEVLDLLAQQAPVARDLRVVLASLRIAQVGELCLGLCRTLAVRAGRAEDVFTPSLRTVTRDIGSETAALLMLANQAWRVLDPDLAGEVAAKAEGCRSLHRRFLAELIEMRDVGVESAVDLGMAARAYERLTDHAVEIAGRVIFAATGATVSVDERQTATEDE